MGIETLPRTEREIIRAAIQGLLSAGYELAVHGENPNGVEPEDLDAPRAPNRNGRESEIGEAVGIADETYLLAYEPGSDATDPRPDAWAWFIHGNGNHGLDVLTDYTTNIEREIAGALQIADAGDY